MAWADPEVADGVDADEPGEVDDPDDDVPDEDDAPPDEELPPDDDPVEDDPVEDDLPDEVPLAPRLVPELDVPDAAVLCCAEAGRATAMAATAATLTTPAPAVAARSLVLPLRRRSLARASPASAGSRSGVMAVLQSVKRSVRHPPWPAGLSGPCR